MTWSVQLSRRARDQLVALHAYLGEAASPGVADRYTDGLLEYCGSLVVFPERGVRRDDIRPGLRITNFRGRTMIAFFVDDAVQRVVILGIFQAGRNYESVLSDHGVGRKPASDS
jgi:plasmid stabilization system protein ParE